MSYLSKPYIRLISGNLISKGLKQIYSLFIGRYIHHRGFLSKSSYILTVRRFFFIFIFRLLEINSPPNSRKRRVVSDVKVYRCSSTIIRLPVLKPSYISDHLFSDLRVPNLCTDLYLDRTLFIRSLVNSKISFKKWYF